MPLSRSPERPYAMPRSMYGADARGALFVTSSSSAMPWLYSLRSSSCIATAYCRRASSPTRTSSATVKPVPVSRIDACFEDGVRSGVGVVEQAVSASVSASSATHARRASLRVRIGHPRILLGFEFVGSALALDASEFGSSRVRWSCRRSSCAAPIAAAASPDGCTTPLSTVSTGSSGTWYVYWSIDSRKPLLISDFA